MSLNNKQPNAAKNNERRGRPVKHKSRGTVDELEILRLILLENRPLYERVLERVKVLKDIAGYQSKQGSK